MLLPIDTYSSGRSDSVIAAGSAHGPFAEGERVGFETEFISFGLSVSGAINMRIRRVK